MANGCDVFIGFSLKMSNNNTNRLKPYPLITLGQTTSSRRVPNLSTTKLFAGPFFAGLFTGKWRVGEL